mmetsp:Transcript_16230/g.29320  ORF Transcript_16230/g.29320 Transcript_16230/m.29320 type:complete len:193 (-) Transcript_16230:190-768(-)|eukprot:CAMPEP_0196143224 /NCGR_PEP_ID=MMETSP0910-20130528/12922_1 /TAXON_ID=49265 /ORGANISM="Thalassiosira rotula, Strain GSO102" /LENGTH=192 /DNA_ID=CAMNT_0041404641 /DNA_START=86 /DNA_END=664 /DNA_ORIENTATION=+
MHQQRAEMNKMLRSSTGRGLRSDKLLMFPQLDEFLVLVESRSSCQGKQTWLKPRKLNALPVKDEPFSSSTERLEDSAEVPTEMPFLNRTVPAATENDEDGFDTPIESRYHLLLRTPNNKANGLPPFMSFTVPKKPTKERNARPTLKPMFKQRFCSTRFIQPEAAASASESSSLMEGVAAHPQALFMTPREVQ